jgi:uncharacterized protein YhdP
MADLGEYWPPKLAHIARDWVLTNIKEGHVREGNFILRIKPEDFENDTLPKDALDLALRFENLTTRYLPELPPLLNASGTARMTIDTLDISVEAGHVKTLQLSEGSVLLSDLSGDNPAVDISFVVSGPVKDGMAVLDMEPFGFATLLGVVPTELGGEMAARARIALPLSENIDEKDVRFAAAANKCHRYHRGCCCRRRKSQCCLASGLLRRSCQNITAQDDDRSGRSRAQGAGAAGCYVACRTCGHYG